MAKVIEIGIDLSEALRRFVFLFLEIVVVLVVRLHLGKSIGQALYSVLKLKLLGLFLADLDIAEIALNARHGEF